MRQGQEQAQMQQEALARQQTHTASQPSEEMEPIAKAPISSAVRRAAACARSNWQQWTTLVSLHKLVTRVPMVLEQKGLHGLKDESLSLGWIKAAKYRITWEKIVQTMCDIEGNPIVKDNPKAEYLLA